MIYSALFIKSRVTITESGCWEWKLSRDKNGYGTVSRTSSDHSLAHRLSYSIFFCDDPTGYSICHKCDNPPCVNPDHLFKATQEVNVRDAIVKGRKPSIRVKLTPEVRAEIFRRLDLGEKQRCIARDLNISEAYLSNVKNGNRGL
jgi:hypothetical protein